MEPSAVTTEKDERELRRIGRRVASELDSGAGRAIPAARRRLFEEEPQPRGLGARWVVGLAAVGAVAAIALALRDDPTERAAARGGSPSPTAAERAALPGLQASAGSRYRIETKAEGAAELVLERGDASGAMGSDAAGPRAVVAGPYRVTGEAELTVRWDDAAGLTVEVTKGEARVLAPGRTPVIVSAGRTKKLPAQP